MFNVVKSRKEIINTVYVNLARHVTGEIYTYLPVQGLWIGAEHSLTLLGVKFLLRLIEDSIVIVLLKPQ